MPCGRSYERRAHAKAVIAGKAQQRGPKRADKAVPQKPSWSFGESRRHLPPCCLQRGRRPFVLILDLSLLRRRPRPPRCLHPSLPPCCLQLGRRLFVLSCRFNRRSISPSSPTPSSLSSVLTETHLFLPIVTAYIPIYSSALALTIFFQS
jgi:hypothetical protein